MMTLTWRVSSPVLTAPTGSLVHTLYVAPTCSNCITQSIVVPVPQSERPSEGEPLRPAVYIAPATILSLKPDTACQSIGAMVSSLSPYGTSRATVPGRNVRTAPPGRKYRGILGLYAGTGALGATVAHIIMNESNPRARLRHAMLEPITTRSIKTANSPASPRSIMRSKRAGRMLFKTGNQDSTRPGKGGRR